MKGPVGVNYLKFISEAKNLRELGTYCQEIMIILDIVTQFVFGSIVLQRHEQTKTSNLFSRAEMLKMDTPPCRALDKNIHRVTSLVVIYIIFHITC